MATDSLDHLAERLAKALRRSAGADAIRSWRRPLRLLLAEGKPVSPEQVAASLGQPREEAALLLRQMSAAELDDGGHLVGRGLTLRPTPHRFDVEGRALFTWCALDALMYPAQLARRARVASPGPPPGRRSGWTSRPKASSASSPPTRSCLWSYRELAGDIRHAFCHNVRFFSSTEAASEWLRQHPDAVILPVASAFQPGRLVARYLGKSL